MSTYVYDPVVFVSKVKIFSLAVVGSFVTMKLINSLYDCLYEPVINNWIKPTYSENYYLPIGRDMVKIDSLVKDILKWLILIIILMIIYNMLT